ncbi:putative nuclease HARBI1 [Rhipicephalus sanguineus]|uniref:putative nuclease HARBI1 n=1 Tax=Rhipicephalus sanguineus TaxID=34632 RepID=UPI0020C542B1|nr:putative nuclease HARBI1 [Rhipicephalus sanguineus]
MTQFIGHSNHRMTGHSECYVEIAQFPEVLGCIDSTHVQIKPPKDQEHVYRNRKGLYSNNVQAICNAEGAITQLASWLPGSTHDSFVWASCDLRRCSERGELPDGWLLGDSGYALEPWLLTPLRSAAGPAEERSKAAHTRTRQVIERTFGILKGRFTCLHQSGGVLQYSPAMCAKIMVASAVLHNMCVRHAISLDATDAVSSVIVFVVLHCRFALLDGAESPTRGESATAQPLRAVLLESENSPLEIAAIAASPINKPASTPTLHWQQRHPMIAI